MQLLAVCYIIKYMPWGLSWCKW